MNLIEYLLDCLDEECKEVGVRCSKAKRFGLDEIQPDQELTNRERIMYELDDLIGVLEALRSAGIMDYQVNEANVEAKLVKLREYAGYSQKLGTLQLDPPPKS